MTAFEELGVMPEIIRGLEEMGWLLPTPVQAEAVPLILGGGDVSVAAETGSGKTGAFGIPIVQIVAEELRGGGRKGGGGSGQGAKGQMKTKVQLSVEDRHVQLAVSPDGLVCQSRQQRAWCGCRANVGVRKGKYYFEATVRDEGLCRVGWSTASATHELGCDRLGFGFGGTGKKSFGRSFDTYGEPFGQDDVIGCLVDRDNHTIQWSRNGKLFEVAYTIPQQLQTFGLYPAVVLKNAEMGFNFGGEPFKFPPPAGYKGMQDAPAAHMTAAADEAAGGGGGGGKGGKKSVRKPIAFILEPSRELAQQTHEAVVKYAKYMSEKIRSVLVVGGVKVNEQLRVINAGVDVVVGTPGRVTDLIEGGKLSMANASFFVLDEADRLLDTGNQEIIMNMYNRLPKKQGMQVMLFSATLHAPEIRTLSEKIQRFPTWVDLKGKESVPDTVHHAVVRVEPSKVTQYLTATDYRSDGVHARERGQGTVNANSKTPESASECIKMAKPHLLLKIIEAHGMEQALIFCRTKLDCDNLEKFLVQRGGGGRWSQKRESGKENPLSCCVLHGDRRVDERRRNLGAFKDGDVRFLICTDVAARGIDIAELPYVINMTLPDKSEDYVHRVGRVGRADCMGLAISLVATAKEKVWYHQCRNRGRGCTNTKPLKQGGCTIWYDEPQLLKEVEGRLHTKIPALGADLRFKTADGKDVRYGASRDDGVAKVLEGHADALKPAVRDLASLEDQCQQNYWGLRKGMIKL